VCDYLDGKDGERKHEKEYGSADAAIVYPNVRA
jgi:hypothetical protein